MLCCCTMSPVAPMVPGPPNFPESEYMCKEECDVTWPETDLRPRPLAALWGRWGSHKLLMSWDRGIHWGFIPVYRSGGVDKNNGNDSLLQRSVFFLKVRGEQKLHFQSNRQFTVSSRNIYIYNYIYIIFQTCQIKNGRFNKLEVDRVDLHRWVHCPHWDARILQDDSSDEIGVKYSNQKQSISVLRRQL